MRAIALGLVAAAATFFLVAAATRDDEPDPARTPGTAVQGIQVFARMGCGNCHTLAAANANGQIGPNLDARLAGHTAASLRATIVDPPGDLMPADFGSRMSAEELDALVAFLLSSRKER